MTGGNDTGCAPGLSVLVPCYNEQNAVQKGIQGLLDVLEKMDAQYEVLAIEDGSEDATRSRLKGFGRRVRVLANPRNMGYGASLKRGLLAARYNTIAITDADGTYPPAHLPELHALMQDNNYDMVVGARTGDNVAIPQIRKPAKWILGKLANFVAGQHIPDVNSGLRIFRRDAAMQVYNLLPDGFSFTTTITLALLTTGKAVQFVPIAYLKRIGSSKIRPVRDTLNFLMLIARISLYFAPLKILLPPGLILMALSIVWGLVSYVLLGRLADASTLALFLSGLQISMLAMLAEMINMRLPLLDAKRCTPPDRDVAR